MVRPIDLVGLKFGRLLVTDRVKNSPRGGTRWLCLCECGNTKIVSATNLKTSQILSCGCLRKEIATDLNKSHGMTNTKMYNSWRGMKSRCSRENDSHFHLYGGRGITYESSWESFDNFYKDMGASYIDGFELDRIDVNGNYCKENCRWSNQSEQCYNQRKRKDNSSGRTGVSWHNKKSRWIASIRVDNKMIHIGTYISFEDAVKAREEAEIKYYGYNRE